MRETAREAENAPGYVHLARSILADPTARVTKIDLRGLLAAYDAERDARERAERERDLAEQSAQVTREQWMEAFRRLAADRVPVTSTHLLTMLDDVLAERDTLRERVAVLQAECQAGRAARDHARPPVMVSNVTVVEYGRRAKAWADEGVRLLNLHDAARACHDTMRELAAVAGLEIARAAMPSSGFHLSLDYLKYRMVTFMEAPDA